MTGREKIKNVHPLSAAGEERVDQRSAVGVSKRRVTGNRRSALGMEADTSPVAKARAV